ncbi:hypothetical protein TIFTF001_046465 [Ficus carica]|uniref:Uncharacterized protein n=1 Tax=Ficus carica TaxID=3494 RepID=A0AA87ZBB3_FICCA|nr:hypothetical protein TIFTF001_046465 [Ficus carica]
MRQCDSLRGPGWRGIRGVRAMRRTFSKSRAARCSWGLNFGYAFINFLGGQTQIGIGGARWTKSTRDLTGGDPDLGSGGGVGVPLGGRLEGAKTQLAT